MEQARIEHAPKWNFTNVYHLRVSDGEKALIVEEPGFKNVKNKHLGMSPF